MYVVVSNVLKKCIANSAAIGRINILQQKGLLTTFDGIAAFSTKMAKPSVYVTREINEEALDILNQQ